MILMLLMVVARAFDSLTGMELESLSLSLSLSLYVCAALLFVCFVSISLEPALEGAMEWNEMR